MSAETDVSALLQWLSQNGRGVHVSEIPCRAVSQVEHHDPWAAALMDKGIPHYSNQIGVAELVSAAGGTRGAAF